MNHNEPEALPLPNTCSGQDLPSSVISQWEAELYDHLSVFVTLECGTIRLRAQDVLDLQSGQTFEILLPEDNIVTLRIDNMVVGQGRIVDEGGSLSLEIVSLTENLGTQQTSHIADNETRGIDSNTSEEIV